MVTPDLVLTTSRPIIGHRWRFGVLFVMRARPSFVSCFFQGRIAIVWPNVT